MDGSYRDEIDRKIARASVFERKLESVFPPGNQWHDRIFYDTVEGKYYDKYSDVYLTLDEMKQFGGAFRSEDEYEVERVESDPSGAKSAKLREEIKSWDKNINDVKNQIAKHKMEIAELEKDEEEYASQRMKALDKLRALTR